MKHPKTALSIASLRVIYLAIIMDRYEAPQSEITIALLRGLYLTIIKDRYEAPQNCP
jgi:hypothetical protein